KFSLGKFLLSRMSAYYELIKFRLSFLVAFSSGFGYVLASGSNFQWSALLWFSLGALAISGAAININQILEKDYDRLMKRTESRPLPTGRVSVNEAWLFSMLLLSIGVFILSLFSNYITIALSLLSFLLYSF